MLRISTMAVLGLICTSAFAQNVEADKSLKFGAGCIGAVTTLAPRFGTCTIDGDKTRIWCPNGQVFDRVQKEEHTFVIRSICNLNQVL